MMTHIDHSEYCTHASVVDGQVTSFVACPSNDMLMTYDDSCWPDLRVTPRRLGRRADSWVTFRLTSSFPARMGNSTH
jgi:hypothetical protein